MCLRTRPEASAALEQLELEKLRAESEVRALKAKELQLQYKLELKHMK